MLFLRKKIIRKVNTKLRILLLIMGNFFLLFLYFLLSSFFLHEEYYSIEADILASIRIVQLTDLHNAEFGKDNCKLVSLVEKNEPDIIFMTGDMLNRDEPNTDIVENLISELVTIAPVYFSYGNHETRWEKIHGVNLHDLLFKAGATVLDCEYADVNVNGQNLRIGGYMAYWGQAHMLSSDPDQKQKEYDFMYDYVDTDRYKILLNHIPTQWVDWRYIDKTSVDLVFCGHYHGGHVRIPLIDRGLYAPYVGWFPKNTKGVFEGKDAICVLSSGLGTEHSIPRFNNPPEIVIVDILPSHDMP